MAIKVIKHHQVGNTVIISIISNNKRIVNRSKVYNTPIDNNGNPDAEFLRNRVIQLVEFSRSNNQITRINRGKRIGNVFIANT